MKRVNVTWVLGGLALGLLSPQRTLSESPPATPSAGLCESPYPDPQGNVTILCRGLTDDQIRLMPALSTLLDKLLHSGVDGARLESQTERILKMLQTGAEPKVDEARPNTTPVPATPIPKTTESPQEVLSYDYRGNKTSSVTGILPVAGETEEYQKLLTLQKAGDWKKLLKGSEHEIKKVPIWLTPYAFKGVALQHLGRTPEAIATLEFVDKHSVGNPDYDQVRHLLEQLKRPEK